MRTFITLLIVIGLAVGGGWYYKKTHPKIVSVRVVTVEKGRVESTVSNTRAGTVKACRRARLSPSLGGQIVAIPHAEGAAVKKGDVLLELDSTDIQAQIRQFQTQIVSARDHAKATCIRAEYMTRTAQRKEELHPQAISRDAYDKVKTEAQIAREECRAANSAIRVAQSSLDVAQKQRAHTRLRAPFDGILAQVNAKTGEYVAPAPSNAPTPPVIDLIAPGCFVVTVPIDEVDASRITPGMAAHVTLDAWRGRKFPARVTRLGNYVVDRQKQARTVDVELKLTDTNLTDRLLAGYSADATIVVQAKAQALRIPTQALLDETHVLVLDTDSGKLVKQTIVKGMGNWSYTEITQGLEAGDKVVLSLGEEGVKAGALARVAEEKPSDKKGAEGATP